MALLYMMCTVSDARCISIIIMIKAQILGSCEQGLKLRIRLDRGVGRRIKNDKRRIMVEKIRHDIINHLSKTNASVSMPEDVF